MLGNCCEIEELPTTAADCTILDPWTAVVRFSERVKILYSAYKFRVYAFDSLVRLLHTLIGTNLCLKIKQSSEPYYVLHNNTNNPIPNTLLLIELDCVIDFVSAVDITLNPIEKFAENI